MTKKEEVKNVESPERELTLIEKLANIQAQLKAPKDLFNNFGKYRYRSNESILEAVKPLLSKYNLVLTQNDEIVQMGDRFYIKAVSAVTDGMNEITATAYAREALTKKGMDDSQVTGATSSYARKYSLNGLFLIDDTKDADTDDYKKSSDKQSNMDKDFMAKWRTWIDKEVEKFPERSEEDWQERRAYVAKTSGNNDVLDYFDSAVNTLLELKAMEAKL